MYKPLAIFAIISFSILLLSWTSLTKTVYSQELDHNLVQASESHSSKVDPKILESNDEIIKVIVEKKSNTEISPIVNDLESKNFDLGNYEYLKVPKKEIEKLEKLDSVKRIELVKEYSILMDVSAPLIKADRFWSNGFNGSGIKVCVIDTGINKSHPVLASRVIAEKDFVTSDSDGNNPTDFRGHGTHIAGIVASTDSFTKGIGFGASILNAKVFDSTTGKAPTDAIKSGIDWCISQNASVLTLSLGTKDETNDGSDVLSNSLDLASDNGKVVVVAAGNSGPGGNPDCRTSRSSTGATNSICSPGVSHKAITVGSTQSGKLGTIIDLISSFSSRGPTGDSRIKPDIVAPGEVINSTWIDGSFATSSGTSMSAPHIAGLAALMLQLKPDLAPEEIKALLKNTAVSVVTQASNKTKYGSGRVNASKAFDEISNTVKGSIINDTYTAHNIFVPNGAPEIKATLYWPENYSVHNDLDLYLLDPLGGVRKSSTNFDNTDESISLSNPFMSGNWKLWVKGGNVSGSQPYVIASNIKPSEQMSLVTNSTSSITYHKINVSASPKRILVTLDWNLTSGSFNIQLYNTTGTLVNISSATNANYQELSAENTGKGLWLVKIIPNSTQPPKDYALSSNYPVLEKIDLLPVLSKLVIKPLKPSVFQILWETNVKTYSILEYGLTNSYGTALNDSQFSVAHNVTIFGLNESTAYQFRIKATDIANNTIYFNNLNFATGSVEKVNLTANQKKSIFFSKLNATLDFLVNSSLQDTRINMSLLRINPIGTNLTAKQLDKYLDIEPDQELKNSLSHVIIKMSYTDDELQGAVEDNLRLFLWNSTEWVSFDPPLGGVNKTGKYVWANRTGFSTYSFGAKSTPSLTLSASPSWSITAGTESSVSCSGDVGLQIKLYRNSSAVSNPDKQTLANGPYSYICNNTENVNFTSASQSNNLLVNLASVSPSPSSSNSPAVADPSSSSSSSPLPGNSPLPNPNKQEPPAITKILRAINDPTAENPAVLFAPEDLVQRGLNKIQIAVTEALSSIDTKIQVDLFEKIPSIDDYGQTLKVLPRPDQKYLRIMQISPTTQLKEKVKTANITFNINRTEINETDKNNIALLRFSNSSWQELPTELVNETSDNYVYSSVTPGFSLFVVSTKQIPSTQPEPLKTTPQPKSNQTEGSSATGLAIGSRSIPEWATILIVVVLAIAGLGFILSRKKRKSKSLKEKSEKPLAKKKRARKKKDTDFEY